MQENLRVGLSDSIEYTVEKSMLASSVGSGEIDVLATPVLIIVSERLCFNIIKQSLNDEKLTSVGTIVNMKHNAPTPQGMKITAKATVIGVDRKLITFNVDLYDEKEKIGKCIHERVIVDKEKFINKSKSKLEDNNLV